MVSRPPTLFEICATYLREYIPTLNNLRFLRGIPAQIIEEGRILDRCNDLTTVKSIDSQLPEFRALLEPQWKALCARRDWKMDNLSTTWRETFLGNEQQKQAKLSQVQEDLKLLHQQISRTKELKRPRLVSIRGYNDKSDKRMRPSGSPRSHHISPRPAAWSGGKPSPTAPQLGAPFDMPRQMILPRLSPRTSADLVTQDNSSVHTTSKKARKVRKAIEDAILPYSTLPVASTIGVELEMAISRKLGANDVRAYKNKVVDILAAFQDKQNNLVSKLLDGTISVSQIATMQAKQLLSFGKIS